MKRAFSLVEVMVVVAIIGVIAAVAGPGISEQVRRTRETAALEGVRQVLQEARNEARLRRGCVFVDGADALPGDRYVGLTVSIDVNCDDSPESIRPVAAVGEVMFQTRSASGSFVVATVPRVTFERLGNLHAGSADAILGFVDGVASRRFRVVPAIGAVRQENP